jgi:ferredoxin--NADP+ reductase
MEGWSEGEIIHRQVWDNGLVTLRIAAEVQPFRAGQFFNLGLFAGDELIRRSYSASSAPGEPLEFFITKVDDGNLTPQLTDMPEGAKLYVEKRPLGFFTLETIPPAGDLWLVSTGTGLGPFIAMLRTEEPWERFDRVIVVHGVRRASHLAYAEELKERGRAHGNKLAYVPLVSREEPPPGVLHGRITQALTSGALEEAAETPLTPERSHLMLCGNPAMIEELVPLLAARGLKRHRKKEAGHVSFEKYW